MKTFSYAVDLCVFFVLYFGFDVNWLAAFVASEVVGWSVRAFSGRR